MKKLYFLNEEEKERILNMHRNASQKHYLRENKSKIFEERDLILESRPPSWLRKKFGEIIAWIMKPFKGRGGSPDQKRADVVIGKRTQEVINEAREIVKEHLKDFDFAGEVKFVTEDTSQTISNLIKQFNAEKLEIINKRGGKGISPEVKKEYNVQIDELQKQIDELTKRKENKIYKVVSTTNIKDILDIINKKVRREVLNDNDKKILENLSNSEMLKRYDAENKSVIDYIILDDGRMIPNQQGPTAAGIEYTAKSKLKSNLKPKGVTNWEGVRWAKMSPRNMFIYFITRAALGLATPFGIYYTLQALIMGGKGYGTLWDYVFRDPNVDNSAKGLKNLCTQLAQAVPYTENGKETSFNSLTKTTNDVDKKIDSILKENFKDDKDVCGCESYILYRHIYDEIGKSQFNKVKNHLMNIIKPIKDKKELEEKIEKFYETEFEFTQQIPRYKEKTKKLQGRYVVNYSGTQGCLEDLLYNINRLKPELIGMIGADEKKIEPSSFIVYYDKEGNLSYKCKKLEKNVFQIVDDARTLIDQNPENLEWEQIVEKLNKYRNQLETALRAQ